MDKKSLKDLILQGKQKKLMEKRDQKKIKESSIPPPSASIATSEVVSIAKATTKQPVKATASTSTPVKMKEDLKKKSPSSTPLRKKEDAKTMAAIPASPKRREELKEKSSSSSYPQGTSAKTVVKKRKIHSKGTEEEREKASKRLAITGKEKLSTPERSLPLAIISQPVVTQTVEASTPMVITPISSRVDIPAVCTIDLTAHIEPASIITSKPEEVHSESSASLEEISIFPPLIQGDIKTLASSLVEMRERAEDYEKRNMELEKELHQRDLIIQGLQLEIETVGSLQKLEEKEKVKESKDKELESWKSDIESKLGMLSSMQAEIMKLKAKSHNDYGIAPEHWLNVKSNIIEGVILYIAKLGWLKHGLLNDPALKDLAIEKYEDIRNAIFADLSRQPDVSRLLSTPALVVPPLRNVEGGFQPFQFFPSQGHPIESTSVMTTQRQSEREGGQPSGEKSFKF